MNLTDELLDDLVVAEAEYLGLPVPVYNIRTLRARINRLQRLAPKVEGFWALQAWEQDAARFEAQGDAIASAIRSLFTAN